jgi:hypothetical protein
VLLVANQPAFQHLAETMDPDAYAADMYQAVRCTTEPPAGPTQGRSAAVGTIRTVQSHIDMEGRHLPIAAVSGQTPDRFLRLPADTQALEVAGPLPTPTPEAHLLFPGDSALRVNWRHLVYTDGSAPAARNHQTSHSTKRRTGSGVYRPAGHTQDGSRQDELCVRLDPAGQGITNTINRAELAPIEYALREGVGTQ